MENITIPIEQTNPSQTTRPLIPKSLTGIKGFDDISFGGLPKNRPTLLVGTIGTGKTFMAMEYIINGIVKYGETGVFMTFEEKTDELILNVSTLGHDLHTYIEEDKIYLEHLCITHTDVQDADNFNIDGLFVRLEQAINKVKASRVVLDAMDTLFASLDVQILRSEYKRLFSWLKERQVTAIVTAEMGNEFLTRMGLEEHVADCVIELNNRVFNQITTRRLRIVKYRGSYHANNEFPFTIDHNGMNVYPIISLGMHHPISHLRISSGIPALDEMLDQHGYFVGSSILISGSAGTGKTSMLASFAHSVCSNGGLCLFCVFEEEPNQFLRNMSSVGLDLLPHLTENRLQFYYARPTLQNLELHFMAIKEVIEKMHPNVILLDPLTNLISEGINSNIRGMLTQFIDHLKTKQITVLFSAAIINGSSPINPLDEGISSLVDTWMMLENCETAGERNRSLYILKSRGMNHSKEVRDFILSNDGIQLLPFSRNNHWFLISSRNFQAEKDRIRQFHINNTS